MLEATVIDISTISDTTTIVRNEELNTIEYPVGSSLSYNLPIIHKMVDNFLQIKKDHIRYRHKIKLLCKGNSGSIIAAIFADRLVKEQYDVKVVYVSKKNENRHCPNHINSFKNEDVLVIVDDFISSGDTVNSIFEAVKKYLSITRQKIDVICVSGIVDKDRIKFPTDFIICKDT